MKLNHILLLGLACAMAACTAGGDGNITKSGLNPKDFQSTIDGKPTALYVLTNSQGMEVCVTNYGGRIVSIMVPDRDGQLRDVVLGHDNIDNYVNIDGNFGALIGRYGNRIDHGRFTLDGKQYQLPINDNGHSLHGGPKGYHTKVWTAQQPTDTTLVLTLKSPDGDAGYPGNLDVKVTYTLTSQNAIDVTYQATTDKPTVVNLTNHSYFNLSGDGSRDILDQEVMISADSITPIDSTFMTHNTLMAVAGTPMDFRQAKAVGRDIEAPFEQLRNGHGYDHNYVLNTGGDIGRVAVEAYSPTSGIVMQVRTTEPGVQFYVGNFLDGKVVGKRGVAYPWRSALVFETQHYPNSPNCPAYPSTVLRPGQTYQSHTIFTFSVRK